MTKQNHNTAALSLALAGVLLSACASAPKEKAAAAPVEKAAPSRAETPPPPPPGPTRTSFKIIAKKLVKRCITGGWISRWRSEQADVDVARPKVFLEEVDNRTEQDLDPSYLTQVLSDRIRLTRVFELVDDPAEADFIGDPTLRRLAEERRGQRYSVYTATLNLKNPQTKRSVHGCEASVRGEL